MASKRGRRDPYAILGVSRSASDDEIKKVYRRLAQKHHPDRNPDDARAEERFKEVSGAYSLLSDTTRRQSYDEFGEVAWDPNFDAAGARRAHHAFGGGRNPAGRPGGGRVQFDSAEGFGGLFEDLFGAAAGQRRGPQKGADLETRIDLSFEEAALGGEHTITLERASARGEPSTETLTIRIPPGVSDGGKIRLTGKGAPSGSGGPPGDLYATIAMRPHRVLRRRGRDLELEAPISVTEAVLGANIEVPTLDGRVTLHIPPGTDGGTKLRLRGKGIPGAGDKAAGDLYVLLRVRVAKDLDDAEREKYAALADEDGAELRQNLF